MTEKQIPYLVSKVKDDIIKALEPQASVALTADLWSDRRLRSFLGVTVHIAFEDNDSYSLKHRNVLQKILHFHSENGPS